MARNGVNVGIDLEQAAIAGAQIRGGKIGQTLMAAAVRALPEGLVFEGEVVDVDGLAAQLKSFWKEAGFSGRRLRLGVANQKIVVRTMEFPLIDEKELEAAIQYQAQEAIPIPLEEAILDYQVLATAADEEGAGRQKVLVVAAQRDMISRFTEVAKKAGLSVDGIDLQAFALTRAVAPVVPFIDQGGGAQSSEPLALVHMGSGITNLVVAAGGMPQFTRVINLGCEALVQALVRDRGVSHDEADSLRLRVGLSGGPDDDIADLEADTVAEIHRVLDAACESFADEIRRSIDYYHSQGPEGQISSLLITGEGALTRNVPQYLSEALHMPVSLGNPLQRVTENRTKLSQAELELMAPRLTIAIGLALEDEE
ncbi:MAG TPA: type IV pilus assembly protein PilM [Thermoleophilia bacterium]|nr:type IV pilus assembly protein PilM [Thermoleophilia bacterium]HQG03956.1 type IV pilus assembly protein PilM [Thermoleophilia bacterium]HQG54655.1 type IV pilus assembly protein PilM [Thermoleophilia bacterium]